VGKIGSWGGAVSIPLMPTRLNRSSEILPFLVNGFTRPPLHFKISAAGPSFSTVTSSIWAKRGDH